MTGPSPVPALAAETSRVSASPVPCDADCITRVWQMGAARCRRCPTARARPPAARRSPPPACWPPLPTPEQQREGRGRASGRRSTGRRPAGGRDRSRRSPSANGARDPGTARLGNADRPGGGPTALPSDFDRPPGARDAATARQAGLNGCEYKSFSLQSRPVKECAPGLVRTAFRSTRCRRAPVVWTPGRVWLRTPVSRRQWGNQSSLHWKHC